METKVMNCIMCPMGCEMTVTLENGKFAGVTGNSCPRGAKYAETEVTDPRRMLTTTVRWPIAFAACGFGGCAA